jgi:hypothetical protein
LWVDLHHGPVSVNILTVNQTVEALCRARISGGDWKAALTAGLYKLSSVYPQLETAWLEPSRF